jgi:hypothetical protein
MRYVRQAQGSSYCPKLVGSYEREIHAVFEEIGTGEYDRVIDVGAAEGYYAVGMAMRLPRVPVTAFETEPRGQQLIREMARLNGVDDRIKVLGTATPELIEQSLRGAERPLLIMDVEGAESLLLDPASVASLSRCHILVETHDSKVPGITALLRRRFAGTHSIAEFTNQRRRSDDCPEVVRRKLASDDEAFLAVWENRGLIQAWLWMNPNRAGAA